MGCFDQGWVERFLAEAAEEAIGAVGRLMDEADCDGLSEGVRAAILRAFRGAVATA